MERPTDNSGIKQPNENGNESFGTCRRVWSVTSLSALVFTFFIGPVLSQEPVGKDLRSFYQQNCAMCHGLDGSAVDAEGKKLRGQDLTDTDWQRGTRDDEMVKTILKGKFFGRAMPSFKGALTEEEAQVMVTDIIRKSKKGQVIAPNAEIPGEK